MNLKIIHTTTQKDYMNVEDINHKLKIFIGQTF